MSRTVSEKRQILESRLKAVLVRLNQLRVYEVTKKELQNLVGIPKGSPSGDRKLFARALIAVLELSRYWKDSGLKLTNASNLADSCDFMVVDGTETGTLSKSQLLDALGRSLYPRLRVKLEESLRIQINRLLPEIVEDALEDCLHDAIWELSANRIQVKPKNNDF